MPSRYNVVALCPSVCLSVTSQSSTKTAKQKQRPTIAQGLFFRCQRSWWHYNVGAEYRCDRL